jgi:signal transduction histidine kinase/DNA-binding response OmpR family regulator
MDDLKYLRSGSLRTVLLCLIPVLYAWGIVLFLTQTPFGPVWLGLVLLAGGAVVAFIFRDRNLTWAAVAAILGVAACVVYNMWLVDARPAPYMLAVVVSLAGLLFGMRTVVWVTVMCSALVITIGALRWGYSPFSAELLSPVLVIGAVGILSSLVVRNLYLALYWALERTMAAQHNQEELRERQGQLTRTLKALDEAYQRLEYLNYDLARAREAAEEARLIKQQFVTSVSHELRTPLNVVAALSEMMYLSPERYGGGPLPPAYRGDVREIYLSGKHLLHLIDDVLDMSQVGAGRMRIDLEPVELRSLIAGALDMIRPLVQDRGITLSSEVPIDLPLVLIDYARVQQVLLNLLNNARRFTERGSITVQATFDAGQIRVTVADTGIGILPEEHDSVFKEFYQVEVSIAGRRNGSGLGLAISKRFIEMHGGRIWVESDGVPGHGSRFHFTLPVAGVELVGMSTLQETRTPVKPPVGRGRTLLLLDQDRAIVQMLEQELEEYRVVSVDDVSEVPRLVEELHARAVVLNLAQRGRVGRQLRALRRELGQSSPPVILCPLVGERQMGQALGVMGYLSKPVSREVLTAVLDQLGESVHRVLVIDDDQQMVRLLSRMLQMAEREYEVVRAYNGRDGLHEMRSQRPDLVLLDLIMPEMDGYSLLAQMREDAALHDIPVVVITAQTRTLREERQLGGKTLCISTEAGFTNEEVMNYLRPILNAISIPSPLRGAG